MGFGKGIDGGCGKVMQYLLFLANFLIFVGGLTVLSVGIWTLVDKNQFSEIVGTTMYSNAAILLIFAGVIVVIISCLGCLGALKENKCMLLSYFVILLIIFLFMLTAGILAYVFRDEVGDKIEDEMKDTMEDYNQKQAIKQGWDLAQSRLKCCGVITKTEWGSSIPSSCCPDEPETCTSGQAYSAGCKEKVKMYVKDHAKVIGGVGIGIACIMILGMIFSIILYKMID
ncbi:Tetraspanin-11 [Amphibalanus amphitrite]|uniref:Tetraspanin n=1 Tax=Amphibalanus amphitrite TaxID=1232801 RepID=A0A6A4X3Y0_AMPAM|nr:tetraspanin-9-like [Amphibalanus amphitrite]KAF0305160.1 Tetraspanin-11 [Amphibalanus amphitrite]KAF0309131.1 Tetraspanin-11 [Amphibalanus amphitrite]